MPPKEAFRPPSADEPVWRIPAITIKHPSFGPGWMAAAAFLIVVVFSQTGLFSIPLKINGPVEIEGGSSPYVPPGPGPAPPGPGGPYDRLAVDAAGWAVDVDTRDLAGESGTIADEMDATASAGAAGAFRDLDAMFADLSDRLKRSLGRSLKAWDPWSDRFAAALGGLYESRQLQTPADGAECLRAVASELRRVR
ncbi:MAG: hypothetical protein WBC44_01450 [Planctomycetaceae bacterium]